MLAVLDLVSLLEQMNLDWIYGVDLDLENTFFQSHQEGSILMPWKLQYAFVVLPQNSVILPLCSYYISGFPKWQQVSDGVLARSAY